MVGRLNASNNELVVEFLNLLARIDYLIGIEIRGVRFAPGQFQQFVNTVSRHLAQLDSLSIRRGSSIEATRHDQNFLSITNSRGIDSNLLYQLLDSFPLLSWFSRTFHHLDLTDFTEVLDADRLNLGRFSELTTLRLQGAAWQAPLGLIFETAT